MYLFVAEKEREKTWRSDSVKREEYYDFCFRPTQSIFLFYFIFLKKILTCSTIQATKKTSTKTPKTKSNGSKKPARQIEDEIDDLLGISNCTHLGSTITYPLF